MYKTKYSLLLFILLILVIIFLTGICVNSLIKLYDYHKRYNKNKKLKQYCKNKLKSVMTDKSTWT